jgi:hypothetical protein
MVKGELSHQRRDRRRFRLFLHTRVAPASSKARTQAESLYAVCVNGTPGSNLIFYGLRRMAGTT